MRERPPGKVDLAQLAEPGREWPPGVVLGIRFDGSPAVLARLDRIAGDLLRELIIDA